MNDVSQPLLKLLLEKLSSATPETVPGAIHKISVKLTNQEIDALQISEEQILATWRYASSIPTRQGNRFSTVTQPNSYNASDSFIEFIASDKSELERLQRLFSRKLNDMTGEEASSPETREQLTDAGTAPFEDDHIGQMKQIVKELMLALQDAPIQDYNGPIVGISIPRETDDLKIIQGAIEMLRDLDAFPKDTVRIHEANYTKNSDYITLTFRAKEEAQLMRLNNLYAESVDLSSEAMRNVEAEWAKVESLLKAFSATEYSECNDDNTPKLVVEFTAIDANSESYTHAAEWLREIVKEKGISNEPDFILGPDVEGRQVRFSATGDVEALAAFKEACADELAALNKPTTEELVSQAKRAINTGTWVPFGKNFSLTFSLYTPDAESNVIEQAIAEIRSLTNQCSGIELSVPNTQDTDKLTIALTGPSRAMQAIKTLCREPEQGRPTTIASAADANGKGQVITFPGAKR